MKPSGLWSRPCDALLEGRHAAELGGPDDQRVVEQPALLEIGEQRRGRLVEDRAVDVVLRLERLVPVPVADAFAHRVGAVEELHEADAAFDQPPGEQAVAREAGRGPDRASSVP